MLEMMVAAIGQLEMVVVALLPDASDWDLTFGGIIAAGEVSQWSIVDQWIEGQYDVYRLTRSRAVI